MANNYDVHQGISDLAKNNTISDEARGHFTKGSNRTEELPEMDAVPTDPVFLTVLIDSSGSMDVCKEAVLESHPLMLNVLRESQIAGLDALFVKQDLFNTSRQKLNSFTPLSSDEGSDNVTILTSSNYSPDGGTALYKTLHSSLQDLLVMLSYAQKNDLKPQASVALITDGKDTEGEVDPRVIRNLLQELREQKILKSCVLIGLLNSNLTQVELEEIRNKLGFDTCINCGQDSDREIRQAFIMGSHAIAAGSKSTGRTIS